jgi:tRNA-2-methylthio-N6-dimethylallyladenosine synthase
MVTKAYHIETYGCQMNVHDSEKIAGALHTLGYVQAKDAFSADVIVFNTCCIRDTAEKKILGNIGDLKHIKTHRPDVIIAIVGCMTQQKGIAEQLVKKFPFIDIILGTSNANEIADKVNEIVASRAQRRHRVVVIPRMEKPAINENEPVFRTSGTNAWVNIIYGCNNFCTYCIVPFVRGRERSRAPDVIIEEIKGLLGQGYKEITLLGQNVNSYGSDRTDGSNFAKLLAEIGQLPGKFRLRFMTSHPKDFTSEVIDVIAAFPNICNNIHLPVQSGSNAVLKAMNRKYTREKYLDIIRMIRLKMPDCGITSDIMVGFPGETDDDFRDTLALVKEVRFSNAFTFVYSPRKGTYAATLDQVPHEIKKERITELVSVQNEITKELSEQYVGGTFEVLAEDAPKENLLCGRTESGRLVSFNGPSEYVGQFLQIKVTKAKASALFGEIINGKQCE